MQSDAFLVLLPQSFLLCLALMQVVLDSDPVRLSQDLHIAQAHVPGLMDGLGGRTICTYGWQLCAVTEGTIIPPVNVTVMHVTVAYMYLRCVCNCNWSRKFLLDIFSPYIDENNVAYIEAGLMKE